MSMLGFATPAILSALLVLPLIWWLLKLTPPKPEQEVFPPLRILARLGKREETPAKSPWWLTLLRMLLAAAIIFAMAGPVLNPRQDRLSSAGPLLLVMDNSWAAANDWEDRVRAAEDLIGQAEDAGLPVSLALTAETRQDVTPKDAAEARTVLTAARPKPVPPVRQALGDLLRPAFATAAPGTLAYVSDGVSLSEKDETMAVFQSLKPAEIRLLTARGDAALAVTAARNTGTGMEVTATRLDAAPPATLPLTAYDARGRAIGSADIRFEPGAREAKGLIEAPLELRNDFSRIAIGTAANAGTIHLLDEGARRRRVAILGGDAADSERPLLSPVYYIRRALSPFADLVEPRNPNIEASLTEILAAKPSAIVMADIGKVPAAPAKALKDWITAGGTLIRFAGPQLAAAGGSDPFGTVPLRQGERNFGGVLSWNEPQMLAPFPDDGPFAGLTRPQDVHVRRQVLAKPSPDLAERTMASLEDGTPLITRRTDGAGQIILFHVSAETSWSDLPLSGTFVEMLRQIVQLSRASMGNTGGNGKSEPLPPYRLLTAEGTLTTPTGPAQPLDPARDLARPADQTHPPGFYGSEEGFVARNLLPPGTRIFPLPVPPDMPLVRASVSGPQPVDLVPPLLIVALALALIDGLAVLWLNGGLALRRAATAALAPLALAATLVLPPDPARADDSKPGDEVLIERLDTTHLAYVSTGETNVDEISRQGLFGLTQFLTYRTALEPGAPVGVDIAKDELSAFPLIYWPVSATAPMPDQAAINRIGAYMRSGGTVLFDTRDQAEHVFGNTQETPNGQRLRQILADLDVPPLEPVPRGHVLTRSFYLLSQFPGRYADSPLWVEAGQGENRTGSAAPVSADGVTPIMITANDFAGAWAMDDIGNPLLPTVPPDETQREYAFRTGVNIMMYMLTGNYKGDQVHVPALLERLGN
jgi:hypothetical protein